MNNQEIIEQVRQRILDSVQLDRLILFGSRARNDAREDSDVDLLVVMNTDAKPVYRSLPIRRALKDIHVSKDIVVYTPEEFQSCLPASASLAARAAEEGVELYRSSTT